MRYEITKEFSFDSAHQLPGEEIFGKCNNLHGHSYLMFIVVGANILENGMVMNFVDLKKVVEEILEDLDHCFLNDISWLKGRVTTCEHMSESIFLMLEEKLSVLFPDDRVRMVEVKLYETPTSSCTYRR